MIVEEVALQFWVFYNGAVWSNEGTDQMRQKGHISAGGGGFGCLRQSPLKWLEMHLKLTWYGET